MAARSRSRAGSRRALSPVWTVRMGSFTATGALSIGNVGKLTGGALTRAEYTRHAVLCALTPFVHPGLYAAEGGMG